MAQRQHPLPVVLAWRLHNRHSQRSLPNPNPLTDQLGVIDQKRRHAQPSGIADSQVSSRVGVQCHGVARAPLPRDVLDLIH